MKIYFNLESQNFSQDGEDTGFVKGWLNFCPWWESSGVLACVRKSDSMMHLE